MSIFPYTDFIMTLEILGFKNKGAITESKGAKGKQAQKFSAHPKELAEKKSSSQMVSIWFTYHVYRIYVKSTARDKGNAEETNQSPFLALESTENVISSRHWGMRGVIVGGRQQTRKTEFGFGWMKLLAAPSYPLNVLFSSKSRERCNMMGIFKMKVKILKL